MKLSRVLTYLQPIITCITDEYDLVEVAKEFVMVNNEQRKYFGIF